MVHFVSFPFATAYFSFEFCPNSAGSSSRTDKSKPREFRARIFKFLRSPRINFNEPIPPGCVACVGNLCPAMSARNQVGKGMSYRPASLCSLPTQFQTRFLELIPLPIVVLKFSTLAGRYDNPIPTRFLAPIDCLKISALYTDIKGTVQRDRSGRN
jgi:hypothetical protein